MRPPKRLFKDRSPREEGRTLMNVVTTVDETDEELITAARNVIGHPHGGKSLIVMVVHGYNDDPRELYDIPEVLAHLRRLVDFGFISILVRSAILPELGAGGRVRRLRRAGGLGVRRGQGHRGPHCADRCRREDVHRRGLPRRGRGAAAQPPPLRRRARQPRLGPGFLRSDPALIHRPPRPRGRGITPENLARTLCTLAKWYARIAASLGARVGEPFEVVGTDDGLEDHRGVVIGTVTLDGDGDARVIFPDGTAAIVTAESIA